MSLCEQDREALCICAEAASEERNETETIGLCNSHRVAVEAIIARYVRESLAAAAEEIEAWQELADRASKRDPSRGRSYIASRLRFQAYRKAARIVRTQIPDPRERP